MSKNVKTALLLLLVVFSVVAIFVWSVVTKKPGAGVTEISLYSSDKIFPTFNLLDESQRKFNNDSLLGKWSLIFFGYTHCPDVCPTTMSNLAKIMQKIPADVKKNMQVVFVSIDPARDQARELKSYVEYFDKNFKGVTGTEQQLQIFASALGAIYYKGEVDKNGNYTIDHSSKVFLINPRGQTAGMFDGQAITDTAQFPAERLAKDLLFLFRTLG